MKHWFKDTHFRSLLKNSSYLAASKIVAGVAGIATLAFAGRGLGVLMFGMLILIVSYAKAASGISKFQTWQVIVRYGGHALAAGNHEEFKASTGFAFALDVVSGIGGMIIAVAILPFLGGWFGISEQYLWLAMLYCTLLPTMGAATPVGVLRSLDRFDLIGWQGSVYPIARAILVGIAFMLDAPFEAYIAAWYVTDLGGDLLLWFLGWRELRRRGLLRGIRPTLRPTTLPGAWRFAIHVNLTSSLSDPDGDDPGAADRHLHFPAPLDALHARPPRRAAQGEARWNLRLFLPDRALVLALRGHRCGERLRARLCSDGGDAGPSSARGIPASSR